MRQLRCTTELLAVHWNATVTPLHHAFPLHFRKFDAACWWNEAALVHSEDRAVFQSRRWWGARDAACAALHVSYCKFLHSRRCAIDDVLIWCRQAVATRDNWPCIHAERKTRRRGVTGGVLHHEIGAILEQQDEPDRWLGVRATDERLRELACAIAAERSYASRQGNGSGAQAVRDADQQLSDDV